MRNVIAKLVAAAAMVAASAAPAMACGGGGWFGGGGCSPCSQAYVSPCASYGGGYGTSYGYAGVAAYERLPDPSRYYYVNQGPSFSGPGNYAPVPTYQETALGGYGSPPAVYSYGPRVWPSYRYGYSMQPRYGYGPRSYASRYGYYHQRRYYGGPRVHYGQRYAAPRHAYPHYQQRPLRRMY